MLRAHPLKGQWQVSGRQMHGWWPSSGRVKFAVRQYTQTIQHSNTPRDPTNLIAIRLLLKMAGYYLILTLVSFRQIDCHLNTDCH